MKQKIILSLSLLLVCGISFVIWAFYWEPRQLKITHSQLQWGLKQPLKVAHLTDLHSQGLGPIERKVIAALIAEKPDILVITGDLSTPKGTPSGYAEVLNALPKAPLGSYFVRGNWEYWAPIPHLQALLTNAGIIDLTQKAREIQPELWLLGFDDPTGSFQPQKLIQQLPQKGFRIGMEHSPGVFPQLAGHVDLLLCGHTHGGQIRLPLWGAVFLPPHSGHYAAGWYQQGNSQMYVSRGIGMSVIGARFLSRPELAIIEIH